MNKTMKRLGFVDVKKGWNWVSSYEKHLEIERWNGRENKSGRKCVWFGYGVELGINCQVYNGLKIDEGLNKRINEIWGNNDWNSLLLYKYDVGCELKDHVDRKIFDNRVIIINFCQEIVYFRYNSKVLNIGDGEILEINGSVKHGVRKVSSQRWSLSIRKVIN